MALAPEDLPSAAMPAESPQFGEGTQAAAQKKAMESQGTARGAQAQNQPQGAGAPPAGAPPAPPVQPPPRTPLTPQDLQPGGKVFSQPKFAPTMPWRQELRAWATHPDAGPFLATLRQRADAHQAQEKGKQP